MSSGSSSTVSVNSLVFAGGDPWTEDVDAEETDVVSQLDQYPPPESSAANVKHSNGTRVSIYVQVFEEMLSTALQCEPHLFNEEEIISFSAFANLSYNARLLIVRLLLRKPASWHRLDSLRYQEEMGGIGAIIAAIDEICKSNDDSLDVKQDMKEEREVVDLTLEEEFDRPRKEACPIMDVHASIGSVTPGVSTALDATPGSKSVILAENDDGMSLEALLGCLKKEELKSIAKELQLKSNQKKQELIAAMLHATSSQMTLTFTPSGKHQPISATHVQTKLPFGKQKLRPQRERLRTMVLTRLSKNFDKSQSSAEALQARCIRIHSTFYDIIRRVNLVYFRLTQYTPTLLVAALLPRFKKRAYPSYEFSRSKDIWKTREALLEYEEVLILEGQIDTILGGQVPPDNQGRSGLLAPVNREKNGKKRAHSVLEEDAEMEVKPESSRLRGARLAKEIFDSIYPRWLALKDANTEERRNYGLDRFESGHVLTRIVCKGSYALGVLGHYQQELEVLGALLQQNRWCRGRRGRWHERRALILATHLPKSQENVQRALLAVIDALEDPDTHLIYRPKLQRRLARLEKLLKLSPEDRHTSEGRLTTAKEVVFHAVRVRHRAASLKLDRMGRNTATTPTPQLSHDLRQYYKPTTTPVKSELGEMVTRAHPPESSEQRNGKTIWVGRSGEDYITVEALALQRYEGQGYKGIHCETRIIAMLFGLLFWDIIFAPIPGAFETPYQTAPLDIAEDSFYHSRKDLMESRLTEIQEGKAVDIILLVDSTHRASETWCVGVQWDLVSSEDLLDIVTCIGGDALSMICRVLCEDYTARMSGGPDLFLWNTEKRCCKFVEVKGPGDTLQENQKIWIDVLVRAPVPVEICYVIEQGNEMVKDVKRRRKTRAKTKGSINNSPGSQDEYIPVALHEKTDHLPNFTFTSSIQPTRPCTVEQADFKPTTLRLRDTPPQQSSPWKGKHSSLVNPPEEVLTPPKKRPKICDD